MHIGLSKACAIVPHDAARRTAQIRCCPSSEHHTSSDCDGQTGVVKEVPDMSLGERVGGSLEFQVGKGRAPEVGRCTVYGGSHQGWSFAGVSRSSGRQSWGEGVSVTKSASAQLCSG